MSTEGTPQELSALVNSDSITDKFKVLQYSDAGIFKAIFRKNSGTAVGAIICVGPESAEEVIKVIDELEKKWEAEEQP